MPIAVVVVGPAVSVAFMQQGPLPVGSPTVHVCSLKAGLVDSAHVVASMVRVGHMPASSNNFTQTIRVVRMITHRLETLLATGSIQVLRVGNTIELKALDGVSTVLEHAMLLEEFLVRFHTESVAITVTSTLEPPVTVPVVQEGTVSIGVEICPLELVVVNSSIVPDVMWV
jgi:hypothetical protein